MVGSTAFTRCPIVGAVRVEEVKHLSALVNDLHKLALTYSGALAYKMQTIDLNELVQLTNDSFKGRFCYS